MPLTLDYFKAIQNSTGISSAPEHKVNEAKRTLDNALKYSPNYVVDAKRNGVVQPFIVTPSEVKYKYNILSMPDDELAVGDEIECYDQHWIVQELFAVNLTQYQGVMWLCNHLFKFQNFNSDIIEKWGVLDSGVYSTTINRSAQVDVLDKQFKLLFPLDDDTKFIYVDKRFAVSTGYNCNGEKILDTYVVTGKNAVSKSYGKNGHLLVLDCRSSVFNKDVDNVDLMICDYIEPEPIPHGTNLLNCKILGSTKIRYGETTRFTAQFYDANGHPTVYPMNIQWTYPSLPGITIVPAGIYLDVTVKDDSELIGTKLQISVCDKEQYYEPASITTKVVSL